MASPRAKDRPRLLVIVPGTVNYFYNLSGHRVAEAARGLGLEVDVTTLDRCPDRPYAGCVLSNVAEILHAHGDEATGMARLEALRGRWGALASLAIDCVDTPWYARLRDLSDRLGASAILDLGLHPQDRGDADNSPAGPSYRFLFSGLTDSERRLADAIDDSADRPIPWAFVGHVTPSRAALVDHLVQKVDPRGFVYLPGLAPYPEGDSPHLNQGQFEAVLGRTRYQVWCSHHEHFYMEPERFRTSLLSGGVPIKVVEAGAEIPASAPFRGLMMTVPELADRVSEVAFAGLLRGFRDECRAYPSLGDEVARLLDDLGIATGRALVRAGWGP